MFGLFVQRHAEAAALYNDISVVYVHADERPARRFEIVRTNENNVETVRVYYKKPRSRIVSLFRFLRANSLAFKLLKKPDIIHVHVLTRCGMVALWHKIVHGTPYVITEHWSRYLPGNDFSGLLRKTATRIVARNAETLTTVTEILAKAMLSHGITNSNHHIVPNVVDINLFHPVPHHNETPKIIHISCFENKSKNITGLIDSLKILEDRNIDFKCCFIGNGIDFEDIKNYSKKLHKQSSIIFTGVLEGKDLIDELATGDFLVLSSNYETQGVVLLEAFACGLPVVSTSVGGIPEIVNENNGLLVPPGDSGALADAIQIMLNKFSDYDTNTLRDIVSAGFSYQAVGKFLDGIYKKTKIRMP